MDFFTTERFKKSLEKLFSKSKHYSCVKKNIYKRLNGKTDLDLFDKGYKLNGMHPIARQMKVRANSCGKGNSDGFRLIVFVNKKEKKYYLLDIYPKTGSYAKSNMKSDERNLCLKELKAEKNNPGLYELEFDKIKKETKFKKKKVKFQNKITTVKKVNPKKKKKTTKQSK